MALENPSTAEIIQLPTLPERQVGQFNSTGDTGIVIDMEMQFSDMKDQKLMADFIARFEQASRKRQTDSEQD